MRIYILVFLFNATFALAETPIPGCQYCIDYCVSAAASTGQPTQSCTQVCTSLSYTDCPGMPSPSPMTSPMPTSSPTVSLPPTPPSTGFTTIYSTTYPSTSPSPYPTTGYPEPLPTAPVYVAPPEPPGWPRPMLNFTFGSCYAYGIRLGNNDTSPTFVNVTYNCDGASNASSVVGVYGGNADGSVSFYFYNARNGKTCYGSAAFTPGTTAYMGSMQCPGGNYPVSFY